MEADAAHIARLAAQIEQLTISFPEVGSAMAQLDREGHVYGSTIGGHDHVWRAVDALCASWQQTATSRVHDPPRREKLKSAILSICQGAAHFIDSTPAQAGEDDEARLDRVTIKGNIYCTLAELSVGEQRRREFARAADVAYRAASELASTNFHPTNPARLRVALNYSAFVFHLTPKAGDALSLAKTAHESAMPGLQAVLMHSSCCCEENDELANGYGAFVRLMQRLQSSIDLYEGQVNSNVDGTIQGAMPHDTCEVAN